ncbi:hypothetical protein TNCV_4393271 [Trichonephila clavipes]|nr:hypothetical protein TNCV_4393271 [Trichonephila clavipes]
MKNSSCQSNIRRWILKAFYKRKENLVSLVFIKHYLRSNKSGFADHPEFKFVLKSLVNSGVLLRIDGNYTLSYHMKDKLTKSVKKGKKKKDTTNSSKNSRKCPKI